MADVRGPVFNPASDLKAILLIISFMWLFWLTSGGPAKYEEKQLKPFLTVPEKIGYDQASNSFRDPVGDQYGEIADINIKGNISGSIGKNNPNDKDVDNIGEGTPTSNTDGGVGANINGSSGNSSPSGAQNTSSNGGSGNNQEVPQGGSNTGTYVFFKKPILSLSRSTSQATSQPGSDGTSPPTQNSYFKIVFPDSNSGPLKITGLTIKNIFGKGFIIKGASYLPYQGMINNEKDIFANPGASIYLIHGPSPIGVSFMVNKCMGHLEQYQSFYPPLHPDFAEQAPLLESTYNNCVEAHKNDSDFFLNDWRIYFDKTDISWLEKGSFLRIIDNSGKTLINSFY
jgi:hypothetical protein